MKFKALTTGIALITTLLLSCATDDSPTSSGNGQERTIKADPSFANDIREIFNRRGCTDPICHGSAVQAGLDLRLDAAYDNLVDMPSTQTGIPRVKPGDADSSYLVIKLEGRQTVGEQMPAGRTPLDSIDIQNIRNWIIKGAGDN